ncbi:MAG: hypothetical protein K8F91_22495 [Candidatus Obscuribacterales bacterium]|nr:hypothetical protein [Candidatus Obscuribacterales bacterium]
MSSIEFQRSQIVGESNLNIKDATELDVQIDSNSQQGQELVGQFFEMSSLMEAGNFKIVDAEGPLYEFRAFANVNMTGTSPTYVRLSITGPVTVLRQS